MINDYGFTATEFIEFQKFSQSSRAHCGISRENTSWPVVSQP